MSLLSTVTQASFPYGDFLARLGLDLVAIALFTVLIGLMRDGRRDLFMICVCFNVGLFVVLTVISTSASATAVGFGLFAMLSIIRLRSEPFTNQELGYFFTAIVLALVSGVITQDMPLAAALDAIVLGGVVVADHPSRGPAPQRREVTLDCIHTDDAADMYYIDPDECIDCGACVDPCPVDAIFPEDEVPAQWRDYIKINADYFKK